MTFPAIRPVISTECANDWCGECSFTDCLHVCHDAYTRRSRTQPRTPVAAKSRERVYDAVIAHHRAHGYAPSVRELAAATQLASSTTAYHLSRLAADGRVSMRPGRARTVTPFRPAMIPT